MFVDNPSPVLSSTADLSFYSLFVLITTQCFLALQAVHPASHSVSPHKYQTEASPQEK